MRSSLNIYLLPVPATPHLMESGLHALYVVSAWKEERFGGQRRCEKGKDLLMVKRSNPSDREWATTYKKRLQPELFPAIIDSLSSVKIALSTSNKPFKQTGC